MRNSFQANSFQGKKASGKKRPTGEDTLKGVVQSIVFHNENNGYTVLSLYAEGEEITCVGSLVYVKEGEHLRLSGAWTTHPTFGEQFKFTSCESILPSTTQEIEVYLGSGAIKGVGVSTAHLIVQTFGESTLDVLRDHPEQLTRVPGIGPKKAKQILASYQEQANMQDILLFLSNFAISPAYCNRIIKTYQEQTVPVIKQNPYRLVDDVPGIGFQTADRIAMTMGVAHDSEYRLRAGIRYLLYDAAQQAGHCFLPKEMLLDYVAHLLQVDKERVETEVSALSWNRQLIQRTQMGQDMIYLPNLYAAETEVAQRLLQLRDAAAFFPMPDIASSIERAEKNGGLQFDPLQKRAIAMAVQEGVSILTGGPGTGKTTVLHCVIQLYKQAGRSIALCAPTGRAAKRMTESCGIEAKTIHRLLEYLPDEEEEPRFQRDAEHPLDEDAVIVDEMSMVDIHLMRSLCRALKPGTRLLMVGDIDQLPSVGAGNVLRDLIQSSCFKVTALTQIFRQAASSLIVQNAHTINAGKLPVLNDKTHDFFFERQEAIQNVSRSVVQLCLSRLPRYFHLDAIRDIQVLCPMKKGEAGVYNLNRLLQSALNPSGSQKRELAYGDTLFREGDKVMQIRNNYALEWSTKDGREGLGVFNGDIGLIMEIEPAAKRITVCFDEEKICHYEESMLGDLELSYAMSIHKSQGSEFKAVILPLHSGTPLLFTRNLLYTAITRAVSLVVIVGREGAVRTMVENNQIKDRYCALALRLQELDGIFKNSAADEKESAQSKITQPYPKSQSIFSSEKEEEAKRQKKAAFSKEYQKEFTQEEEIFSQENPFWEEDFSS